MFVVVLGILGMGGGKRGLSSLRCLNGKGEEIEYHKEKDSGCLHVCCDREIKKNRLVHSYGRGGQEGRVLEEEAQVLSEEGGISELKITRGTCSDTAN